MNIAIALLLLATSAFAQGQAQPEYPSCKCEGVGIGPFNQCTTPNEVDNIEQMVSEYALARGVCQALRVYDSGIQACRNGSYAPLTPNELEWLKENGD